MAAGQTRGALISCLVLPGWARALSTGLQGSFCCSSTQSSPAMPLTLSLLRLCLKCHLLREAFSDHCVQILFYSAICAWPFSFFTVQFSSVTQSCPTLCDPRECSTPGLPVHHQLPELAQTHVHRAGDAIQPSHPLSSPSPPAFFIVLVIMLFYWLCLLEWVPLVIVT